MPSQTIQWFPGHMAKTRRMISENLSNVDFIIEILDARIPHSSKNPEIARLTEGKPRVVLLNKASLADPTQSEKWRRQYTESGCICIYDFNNGVDKPNCIGKPTHNVKITIVDEDKNPITSSADNTGLLSSFGPMNTPGYWKDEEETRKALQNGTIYSNDEAYIDEDGDIILLGRKGDVINVGGNKVSPDEIEDPVKKMDGVEDCGCIGISDPLKGNTPKLFVQMKKGCAFDSTAIRAYIAGELEPYKVPSVIEEIDLIPRSFNGKLLRRALRNI